MQIHNDYVYYLCTRNMLIVMVNYLLECMFLVTAGYKVTQGTLWENELGNERVNGTLHSHNSSKSLAHTPSLRV